MDNTLHFIRILYLVKGFCLAPKSRRRVVSFYRHLRNHVGESLPAHL